LSPRVSAKSSPAALDSQRPSAISRATEVHARTLEVLDPMGAAADFVDRGLVMREVTNAHSPAIQMALIESGIRRDAYAAQRPEQSISSSRPLRPQYSLAILRSLATSEGSNTERSRISRTSRRSESWSAMK